MNTGRKTSVLIALLVITSSVFAQNKPNGSTKSSKTSALPAVTIDGTDKVNYVRTFDFFKSLNNDNTLATEIAAGNVLQSTQYYDGLGRPIQTVARKVLPGDKDLIQMMMYDSYNRQVYQPLPFASANNHGGLELLPTSRLNTFMSSHYQDEDIFYGRNVYDNSPANRVLKQMAPGNSWAGSNKGVTISRRPNNVNDRVRIWNVSSSTPGTSTTYGSNKLMVTISEDEEGNKVKEFVDLLGRVILKQVQHTAASTDGHSDWLNTYYLYDDEGNLSYVLPPRAVELLSAASWVWNTTDMDALTFQYTYDGRNRMITKKVPGADRVDMVYDELDRLVATQDGNLRGQNKWLITKYDPQNRPVITGLYSSSSARAALQTTVDTWNQDLFVQKDALAAANVIEGLNITVSTHVSGTTIYRVKTGGGITFLPGFDSGTDEFETEEVASLSHEYTYYQGYYDATFPTIDSNVEVITVSYFDDYDFTTQTFDTGYTDFYTAGTNNAVTPSQYTNVTGLATGSKVKVLGTTDDWLTTVMFYDDRGRVIQTQADNHVGGRDIATTQYDFSGKVLNTYTVHNNPQSSANTQTTIAKRYTYDGSGTGRLLTIQEKLNGTGSHKTIVTNTYNNLGELQNKTFGSNLETLTHSYNVRGWLEGINKDEVELADHGTNMTAHYFAMELSYDVGFTTNQLNGNIAGVKWKTRSSDQIKAYGFDYDPVNRLTKADYAQGATWVNTTNDFSTTYGYDANGNIQNLTRKGVVAGSIQTIDNLSYTYLNSGKSNQLAYVSDAAGDLGQGDFVDGNTSGNDYAYDTNGNMTQDKNKDIQGSDITYNHLNLPTRIEFSNDANKTITYTYDAAGIKLAKTVNNGGTITTTDYVGGFIYENDQLQHFAHEEGRVRKNYQGNLVYDYFVKDHLGNTRMTLTEDTDVTIYLATMETEYKNFEESLFLNMDNSRVVDVTGNYTVDATITADEASRLNGSDANRRAGPGKLMAVTSGDQVDLEVWARYTGTIGTNNALTQAQMVTAVAATFGGVSGGTTEQQSIYNLFNNNAANLFVGSSGSGSLPRAYLNYILFDQDFNYVDAGYDQVSSAAGTAHEKLSFTTLNITEGGYLYVYVSNESNANFDVFFDDLRITHTKGAILQEDHYYPFGMNMAALSSSTPLSKPNRFKFNSGSELNSSFDLNIYETLFRGYDPAIGRFMQIDPLVDFMPGINAYQYGFNNPISFNDPDGLSPCKTRLCRVKKRLQSLRDKAGKAKNQARRNRLNQRARNFARRNKDVISNTTHLGALKHDAPSKRKPQKDKTFRADVTRKRGSDIDFIVPPAFRSSFNPDFGEPSPYTPPRPREYVAPTINNIEVDERTRLNLIESPFGSNSSFVSNPNMLNAFLSPIAKALIAAPHLAITIKVRTNLTDDELEQFLSTDNTVTGRQLLTARGKAIQNALLRMGVDKRQITYMFDTGKKQSIQIKFRPRK